MANIKGPDLRHGVVIRKKRQRGWNDDAEGDCQKNNDCFPFHCGGIVHRKAERCQTLIVILGVA